MSKNRDWSRKTPKAQIQRRSKYEDHSRRFLEWVEGLGFPNTWLGELLISLDQRFHLRRLLGVFIFSLVLASLLLSEVDFIFNVRVGEVAATDIKSPVNLEFVDEVATEEKRREAEVAVPPVFDYDPRTFERTYDNVYRAFLNMRRQLRLTDWPTQPNRLEEAIKDFMVNQPTFEKELGRSIPARLFEWLIEKRFAARIENVMIRSLSQWSNLRLVDGVSKTLSEPVREVLVRTLRGGTEGAEFTVPRSELKEISVLSDFEVSQIRGAETLTERDQKNVVELAQILVSPNLIYNLKEGGNEQYTH